MPGAYYIWNVLLLPNTFALFVLVKGTLICLIYIVYHVFLLLQSSALSVELYSLDLPVFELQFQKKLGRQDFYKLVLLFKKDIGKILRIICGFTFFIMKIDSMTIARL